MPARPIPGQDTGVIGHFVLQGSVPRVADRHNRLQGGAVGRTGGCLGPFTAQVNPIGGAWAGLPTLHLSGPAVHHRASTATSRAQVTQAVSTEPPAQRQFVRPTRFAHPHSWSQSTKTPTFPHHHTEKSPHQQHVVSYNPKTTAITPSGGQRADTPRGRPCGRPLGVSHQHSSRSPR